MEKKILTHMINSVDKIKLSLFYMISLLILPFCVFFPKTFTPLSVGLFLSAPYCKQYKKNYFYYFFILLLVFLVLISVLWSMTPQNTLLHGIKIALILGVGSLWISKNLNQNFLLKCVNNLTIGLIAASFLVYLNYLTRDVFVKWSGHTSTAILLTPIALTISTIIWPLLFWHIKQRKYSVWYIAIGVVFCLGSLFFADCDTAILCSFLSIVVFCLTFWLRKYFIYFFSFCLFFGVMSAPYIGKNICTYKNILKLNKNTYNSSYFHRIIIYNKISKYIFKNPITGFGLKNTRFLDSDRLEILRYQDGNKIWVNHPISTHILHPHNFCLELWVDLGVLGVLCFLCLFGYILYFILREKDKWIQALNMSVFSGLLVPELMSISMWSTSWIFFILLLVGLLKNIKSFYVKMELKW